MGQAEKRSWLDLPRVYKQNIKSIWRVSHSGEPVFLIFKKSFSGNVRFGSFPRLPSRRQENNKPSERW